jgi:hypothetical protein
MKRMVDKLFIRRLNELLPSLSTPRGTYTGEDILRALIGAVQDSDFIEGWVEYQREMGREVPSGDLVHLRLKQLDLEEILQAFNVLNEELCLRLLRLEPRLKPAHLAIDLHAIPYYGGDHGPQVCGGKHERGTSWHHKFGSVAVVDERRFMPHAIPVGQFYSKARLIRRLLEEARRFVKILAVYLDKEFYNVSCLQELEASGERYIVPVRRDKKLNEEMREYRHRSLVVGTRGCTYHTTVRTVESKKESVDVQTVFLFRPGEEEDFVFATNMEVTRKNVEQLADDYGRRWGIETGYRMTEMVRGRTCSQSHSVRRLFHLLSVLLYNLWQLVDAMLIIELGERRRQWGYAIKLKTVMRIIRELVEEAAMGVGI